MDASETTKTEHVIHTETFCVCVEDDGSIVLQHPCWSLLGIGTTLEAAENDLIQEALIIYDAFHLESHDSMSRGFIDMMKFCTCVAESASEVKNETHLN